MASARIERCDVWELSRKGLSLDGRIAVQDMPRLASQLVDVRDRLEFRFSGGTDSRGRPAAVLDLHGTVHAACDRCGKPVPLPLHEQAAFFFVAFFAVFFAAGFFFAAFLAVFLAAFFAGFLAVFFAAFFVAMVISYASMDE